MPAVPIIGLVFGAASLTTGVIAGAKGGKAGRDAADAAKKMGNENAKILERQADQTEKVMGYKLGQFDRQSGQFRDTQSAATAVSGVEMSGSSEMLSADIRDQVSMDRKNMHEEFTNQAMELRNKARLSRKHGASQSDILSSQNQAAGFGTAANIMNGVNNTTQMVADSSKGFWWGKE